MTAPTSLISAKPPSSQSTRQSAPSPSSFQSSLRPRAADPRTVNFRQIAGLRVRQHHSGPPSDDEAVVQFKQVVQECESLPDSHSLFRTLPPQPALRLAALRAIISRQQALSDQLRDYAQQLIPGVDSRKVIEWKRHLAALDGVYKAEESKIVQSTALAQQTLRDIESLNPGVPAARLSAAIAAVQRRADAGCEPDAARAIRQLVPNLGATKDVTILPSPTIDELEETQKLLADHTFAVSASDPRAPLHVLNAIAGQFELDFVLTRAPDPDACAAPAAFAMANDALTADNIFLLGSASRCHRVKGGALRLKTPFERLSEDAPKRDKYLRDVRTKLAHVHAVTAAEIIFVLHAGGSNALTYSLSPRAAPATKQNLEAHFGAELLGYSEVPALARLAAHPGAFAPERNRDFRDPAQVVTGLKRAGFQYDPPEGWLKYGLNVAKRFDRGDDAWAGEADAPGEWAVAYCGVAGGGGKGIRCSPIVATASKDAGKIRLETAEGVKSYAYVFMCRVNVRKVCRCVKETCPNAENPEYTVHITTNKKEQYWLVSENNGEYENIRTDGLLVKEVEE